MADKQVEDKQVEDKGPDRRAVFNSWLSGLTQGDSDSVAPPTDATSPEKTTPVVAATPKAPPPASKPRAQKKAPVEAPTGKLPPTDWQAIVDRLPEDSGLSEDPELMARRKQNELDARFEAAARTSSRQPKAGVWPAPWVQHDDLETDADRFSHGALQRGDWDAARQRAEDRKQLYDTLQTLPPEERDAIVRQLPWGTKGYGKGGWLRHLPRLSVERARSMVGDFAPAEDQGGWIGLEADRPEEDRLREAKSQLQTIVGE